MPSNDAPSPRRPTGGSKGSKEGTEGPVDPRAPIRSSGRSVPGGTGRPSDDGDKRRPPRRDIWT